MLEIKGRRSIYLYIQLNSEDRLRSGEKREEYPGKRLPVHAVQSSRHGEARFFALGYIGNRLHALVFTKSGATVRVISLRRAHQNGGKTL